MDTRYEDYLFWVRELDVVPNPRRWAKSARNAELRLWASSSSESSEELLREAYDV